VLLALTKDRRGYTFDAKQIAGIHHAIKQADERKFASSKQLRAIFGRSL
jgi:hypothetical protein